LYPGSIPGEASNIFTSEISSLCGGTAKNMPFHVAFVLQSAFVDFQRFPWGDGESTRHGMQHVAAGYVG
jgi:hypothetical protein